MSTWFNSGTRIAKHNTVLNTHVQAYTKVQVRALKQCHTFIQTSCVRMPTGCMCALYRLRFYRFLIAANINVHTTYVNNMSVRVRWIHVSVPIKDDATCTVSFGALGERASPVPEDWLHDIRRRHVPVVLSAATRTTHSMESGDTILRGPALIPSLNNVTVVIPNAVLAVQTRHLQSLLCFLCQRVAHSHCCPGVSSSKFFRPGTFLQAEGLASTYKNKDGTASACVEVAYDNGELVPAHRTASCALLHSSTGSKRCTHCALTV